DLLAMDGYVLRRVDADTHLVSLDSEDGDGDFVSDHQRLAYAASQNQHVALLSLIPVCKPRTRRNAHPARTAARTKRTASLAVPPPFPSRLAALFMPDPTQAAGGDAEPPDGIQAPP